MIQLSEFFQDSFVLILKRKCLVGASRVRCGESGTPSTIIYTWWSSRRYELGCDAPVISINSSHRMGQAGAGYNRMLIARLPRRDDQNKFFHNASVLKGTDYSITKQVPVEIEERRQFAWSEFKQAKADKRPARFDGGTLVVGGEPVVKFKPVALPGTSKTLQGAAPPDILRGTSDVFVEGEHRFQA